MTEKKRLRDSGTVRAALVTVIAYIAAQLLGAPPEVANSIAMLGAAAVTVYLRRSVEDVKDKDA